MSRSPADAFAAGDLLCGEDAGEVISGENHPTSSYLPSYSPPSDDATIGGLIDVEAHHMPDPDYLRRCRHRLIDVTARQDAINWILKVHAHYEFRPVTAFLSVNYLDRFLSCSALPRQSQWEYHLLSVACLSLAAKLEEPVVPLLLDLQLVDPRFVFEPKTIQRMELYVMTKLRWRLRSITPFDYLHYFISKVSSFSDDPKPESITRIFSTASSLILSTTLVIDFLGFPPSAIAVAAVLCSAGQGQSPPCFHDGETVRSCHQLMEDYVVDTCPFAGYKGPGADPEPPSSPVGVLEGASSCSGCETRSENPASTSEAEPPNKGARSPDVNGE
ncbi:cyclin-D1-1-like isoform X2 [Prosopis cineraria]|uniref:cyclin-D1-1-like isoform X2 n=1 Tax=Prosopis cineraria TaxID=364024 RepID=UPI002410950A|nr:cyclin-D1-1-like isoform X2 [Prosopis cineraria]